MVLMPIWAMVGLILLLGALIAIATIAAAMWWHASFHLAELRADNDEDGEITYSAAGGPPDNWRKLIVRDLDTGSPITGVIQVDTKAGWLLRFKPAVDGRGFYIENGKAKTERLEGRFSIESRP